jgi:hypothetical protein
MQNWPVITRISAASIDLSDAGSEVASPFRIEVQTDSGPAVLRLSQDAAAQLAEELGTYLQVHGFR